MNSHEIDRIERVMLDLLRDSYPEDCEVSDRRVVAVLKTPDGELHTGFRGEDGNTHAERIAIDKAGAHAAGGVLFCSLEPCIDIRENQSIDSCSKYIVEKKVSKVVFGLFDDNPQIEMRGWELLRSENIEVGFFSEQFQSKLEEITYDGPYNEAYTKRGTRKRFVREDVGLKFRLKLDDIRQIDFKWSIASPDAVDLISGSPDTVSYAFNEVCFEDDVSISMFRFNSHYCRLLTGQCAALKIDESKCMFLRLKARSDDSIEFQWRLI